MKRFISLLFVLILLFSWSSACADRQAVEKDQYYIGAMRVVRCKKYVSLREAPNKTSKQLAKLEPDEIVYSCSRNEKEFAYSPYRKQVHMFTKCVYQGQEGYILSRFLEPAPEYEPVEHVNTEPGKVPTETIEWGKKGAKREKADCAE